MKTLAGKTALIIGGASGIGEATSRLFAAEEAQVIIGDINDQQGQAVADAIGTAAVYRHTDITKESDVQATISYVAETYGRLDCLYNGAGASSGAGSLPIEDVPVDGFKKVIDLLVRGVFLAMKHAAPIMKGQKSGSIINTASVAGLRAGFAPHLYSAAKAAIIHLTRSVAMELRESGVRVNCLCPGGVATPLLARSLGLNDEDPEILSKKAASVLIQFQPLKRACLPEDVAQAALWLASDKAGSVNGHVLVVDGGASAGRLWSIVAQQRKQMKNVLGIEAYTAKSKE